MTDVECADTSATSAILSIGACALNPDGISDMRFYLPIKLESCLELGMTINSDTMDWWRKQSSEAQTVFLDPKAVDIKTAMQAYANWIYKVTEQNHRNTKVWSCGASFDIPMLEHAFKLTGVKNPISFWNHSCYRTVKNAHPKVKIERKQGKVASHNALQDSIEQANHLIEINKQAGGIYL